MAKCLPGGSDGHSHNRHKRGNLHPVEMLASIMENAQPIFH